MGRPAARDLDDHTCPSTAPSAHEGGPVVVARACTVIIGGSPAAVILDPTSCKAGPPGGIAMGSPTVLFNALNAARKYDITTHAGMILEGEPTVLIGGDSPSVLLALAILRIRNSDYGKTPEGKRMVELLESKQKNGTLRVADLPPGQSGRHYHEDEPGKAAKSWEKKDNLVVDEDQLDDVDQTADILVHEGKHDQGRGEIAARQEENELYKEQREHGYEHPEAEKDDEAIRDGTLPARLKKLGYTDDEMYDDEAQGGPKAP